MISDYQEQTEDETTNDKIRPAAGQHSDQERLVGSNQWKNNTYHDQG